MPLKRKTYIRPVSARARSFLKALHETGTTAGLIHNGSEAGGATKILQKLAKNGLITNTHQVTPQGKMALLAWELNTHAR